MMKLSLMQEVVATVNAQWESDLADVLLQPWVHDVGRAKYWRASANFIFYFKRSGQDCVLRFNHASERTAEAIQAEVDYVNALAVRGVRVAKPILSMAGNAVESVETAHGLFHVVVFEALPGKQFELDELTPAQIFAWGEALGELHRATSGYAITGRPTWAEHLAWVAETLPADELAARRELERVQLALRQLPLDERNFGLIHFDFELDNLVWEGDQPSIIDFDDSAAYWFVADIAFALRDLFDDAADKVDPQHESYQHFVRGYASVRPLAQGELKLIPLFLRVHNLIAFARLQRALTPIDSTGELPWMAELRGKLAAKMDFYRAEFAAHTHTQVV